MITVAVVNRNKRELLHECLMSILLAASDIEAEIVVVDNASTDGSAQMVAHAFPEAILLSMDRNIGFAPALERVTARGLGKWLVIVNNDAILEPDALKAMLLTGEADDRTGSVSAQVRFVAHPDIVNTTGLEIDRLGITWDRHVGRPAGLETDGPVEIFGASGCVAMFRTEMLAEIGGFDPAFFAYSEDADVAWRARMFGWRAFYEPRAIAWHHGSATAGDRSEDKYKLVGRNRVRLIAKNATLAHLFKWGAVMVLYDVSYVMYVAMTQGTLAPLTGRLWGAREWRQARHTGRPTRRPIPLRGLNGPASALRMHRAYGRFGSG